VLLVAAEPPYRPGFVADVQSKLLATRAFTTVDVFDAYTATPSLSTLQPYTAVLTWSSDGYYDGSGLGDVLAQYWDGGGGVVVATHANTESYLQGRFGTNDNGYIVIDGSAYQEFPYDTLGRVIEPESRLMAGVASLAASSAVRSTGEVINGGVVVARWASNGRPLVVRGTKAGRPLVALNMWPASSSVAGNLWTGDGAQLMRNTLLYSACGRCSFADTGARGENSCIGRGARESCGWDSGHRLTFRLSQYAPSPPYHQPIPLLPRFALNTPSYSVALTSQPQSFDLSAFPFSIYLSFPCPFPLQGGTSHSSLPRCYCLISPCLPSVAFGFQYSSMSRMNAR
jgi:hypothetical protein